MQQPMVSKKAILFLVDYITVYLTPELKEHSLMLRQKLEALPDAIPMIEHLPLILALDKLCFFVLKKMDRPPLHLLH